jgi:hypothetical protein
MEKMHQLWFIPHGARQIAMELTCWQNLENDICLPSFKIEKDESGLAKEYTVRTMQKKNDTYTFNCTDKNDGNRPAVIRVNGDSLTINDIQCIPDYYRIYIGHLADKWESTDNGPELDIRTGGGYKKNQVHFTTDTQDATVLDFNSSATLDPENSDVIIFSFTHNGLLKYNRRDRTIHFSYGNISSSYK